jgi:hypothetical protein
MRTQLFTSPVMLSPIPVPWQHGSTACAAVPCGTMGRLGLVLTIAFGWPSCQKHAALKHLVTAGTEQCVYKLGQNKHQSGALADVSFGFRSTPLAPSATPSAPFYRPAFKRATSPLLPRMVVLT